MLSIHPYGIEVTYVGGGCSHCAVPKVYQLQDGHQDVLFRVEFPKHYYTIISWSDRFAVPIGILTVLHGYVFIPYVTRLRVSLWYVLSYRNSAVGFGFLAMPLL